MCTLLKGPGYWWAEDLVILMLSERVLGKSVAIYRKELQLQDRGCVLQLDFAHRVPK